ncbi:MAG: hypothetical protein WC294_00085 [Methanoregula sp.]|jgi:hypothetical protein
MISIPTVIPGTSTGLRISAIDGTAFLDNDSAIVQYADGRSRIRIYDASLRYLEGILGAPGTGETYLDLIGGTNPDLNNGDFAHWTADNPDTWALNAAEDAGNYVTESTGKCRIVSSTLASGIRQSVLVDLGLYKVSIGSVSVAAGSLYYRFGSTNTSNGFTAVVSSAYGTSTGTAFDINRNALTSDVTIDNVTLQKVITPSSTGCTLKDAAGAQSFISKDAAFSYNSASYTYRIFTNRRIVNPIKIMGQSTFRN